eukprot:1160463-Pelagomonas_calceolata.AAC.7
MQSTKNALPKLSKQMNGRCLLSEEGSRGLLNAPLCVRSLQGLSMALPAQLFPAGIVSFSILLSSSTEHVSSNVSSGGSRNRCQDRKRERNQHMKRQEHHACAQ